MAFEYWWDNKRRLKINQLPFFVGKSVGNLFFISSLI